RASPGAGRITDGRQATGLLPAGVLGELPRRSAHASAVASEVWTWPQKQLCRDPKRLSDGLSGNHERKEPTSANSANVDSRIMSALLGGRGYPGHDLKSTRPRGPCGFESLALRQSHSSPPFF